MIKRRIHNDINIAWQINADGTAYDLTGRSLQLWLWHKLTGRVALTDFSVSGSVITFIFHATTQKYVGAYMLILTEQKGGEVHTVDRCSAFELVEHSCSVAAGSDDSNILTSSVTLTSEMQLAVKGDKGDKGDAFTFADFTDAQIAELQKPATDAAALANLSAENANKAAKLATDAAHKAASDVATAVDVVNKTNERITTAENLRVSEFSDIKSTVDGKVKNVDGSVYEWLMVDMVNAD